MIWRLRRNPTPPETPLWDHLDACNIAFRVPLSDWVERYHLTPSVWSEGLDFCVPTDAAPFCPGMDVALRAQVSEHKDYDAAPDYLWGAVQSSGDHRLNYARAIAGLTKLFGKGVETSASNTVERQWRFGLARLRCTVWPPDKQHPGRNDRHHLFPETIEEACISVVPAWRPPMSDAEREACRTATPLWKKPAPLGDVTVSRFSRAQPDGAPALPPGLAVADTGDLLVTRMHGLVDIFPQALLTGLRLDRMTPGRSGSGAYLKASFRTTHRDGVSISHREIASVGGNAAALDAVADALAARLDLPLERYTGPSD